MKLIALVVVIAAAMKSSTAQSQTKTAALATFEVASIKASPDRPYGATFSTKSNRFTATSATLWNLVQLAFGVEENQITGSPSWISADRYDITAKMQGEEKLTTDAMKIPLQRLLAERFKLMTHREIRNIQGYALVVAKDGPKIQKSTHTGEYKLIRRGNLRGQNVPMASFAVMLVGPVGRPVEDRTGIAGAYDFELKYAEGPEPSAEFSLPSIFTALQEQLGLKLEPQKVSLEMLVIDHVERVPTEN